MAGTDFVDDRRADAVLPDQADREHGNLLRGAYLFEQVQVERVVVVAEVDHRVRVVRVVVQSYPVEGRPAVGHAAGHGVRGAFVNGRHGAGDVRVRNACGEKTEKQKKKKNYRHYDFARLGVNSLKIKIELKY